MPSAKLRGTNPSATQEQLQKFADIYKKETGKKLLGDVDVTPKPEELPEARVEVEPPYKEQLTQKSAGAIDKFIRVWIEAQKKRRGQPPSRLEIEQKRARVTEAYLRERPEAEPAPQVPEEKLIIDPQTRIRT
jgi:hypothetical protein